MIFLLLTQVFPTNVRAVGLGSSSAFARIGAITTPFVAQASNMTLMFLLSKGKIIYHDLSQKSAF